jgi:BlaI family transcriptional regulator, penicillinase repressor
MQALANAELAVMELLWEEPSLSARVIRERLYPDASRAQHGTVQKLLQRLEDKGFVSRDRKEVVHFFSPRVLRREYAGDQLVILVDKLTDGSVAPLLTHLIEHKKISKDELARLRGLLDSISEREGTA